MKELEPITYKAIIERLRNIPLEQYTKQELFDRYVAYGSKEELNNPKIQRLLIKHGYIQELLEVAPNIDNEVMEEIFKTMKDNQPKDQYCIIDIETTGLSETKDEIIEISIVKVRNSKIADTYSSLIKPSKQLNSNIQRITHISNDLLQYAPSIDTIRQKVLDFIGGDTIVSHNTKFIMKFLQYYIKPIDNEVIDTLEIARQIFPEMKSHKLPNICTKIGIDNFKCNSTMDCCYMTMLLFEYSKTKQ